MNRLISILLIVLPTIAYAANLRISESIMHGQAQTVISYLVRNEGVNAVQSISISVICRQASGAGEASYTVYVSPARLAPGSAGGATLYAALGTCDRTVDRKLIYLEGELPVKPPGAADPYASMKIEPF